MSALPKVVEIPEPKNIQERLARIQAKHKDETTQEDVQAVLAWIAEREIESEMRAAKRTAKVEQFRSIRGLGSLAVSEKAAEVRARLREHLALYIFGQGNQGVLATRAQIIREAIHASGLKESVVKRWLTKLMEAMIRRDAMLLARLPIIPGSR